MIDPKDIELIFYKNGEIIFITKEDDPYISFYVMLENRELFNMPCIDFEHDIDKEEINSLRYGMWVARLDANGNVYSVDWVGGTYTELPEDFKTKLLLLGLE